MASAADLRSAYANIRAQAAEQADGWPHASNVSELCVDGRPPRFADATGPIGIYAMLHRNAEACAMLAACKLEFEAFIALIEAVLNPTQVRELRALVGTRPEPGVLYELSPGHEREVTVTTAGDAEPEAQIATRSAAPAGS